MRRGSAYRRASAYDYGVWKRSNVRKQRPPKYSLMIDVRLRETSYCCVGPTEGRGAFGLLSNRIAPAACWTAICARLERGRLGLGVQDGYVAVAVGVAAT